MSLTNEQVHAIARRVGFPMSNPDWQKAVEEFAALCCEAEREECAKVCEEVFSSTGRTFDHRAVAAAIRARGKP
jgi:hypothetical protein